MVTQMEKIECRKDVKMLLDILDRNAFDAFRIIVNIYKRDYIECICNTDRRNGLTDLQILRINKINKQANRKAKTIVQDKPENVISFDKYLKRRSDRIDDRTL
jgi:hypothetical protein